MLRISAFPKCYLAQIAGARTISVFGWISVARELANPDRAYFGVQYDPSIAIVAGDDPIALKYA
jgi:hypothetical protein